MHDINRGEIIETTTALINRLGRMGQVLEHGARNLPSDIISRAVANQPVNVEAFKRKWERERSGPSNTLRIFLSGATSSSMQEALLLLLIVFQF